MFLLKTKLYGDDDVNFSRCKIPQLNLYTETICLILNDFNFKLNS